MDRHCHSPIAPQTRSLGIHCLWLIAPGWLGCSQVIGIEDWHPVGQPEGVQQEIPSYPVDTARLSPYHDDASSTPDAEPSRPPVILDAAVWIDPGGSDASSAEAAQPEAAAPADAAAEWSGCGDGTFRCDGALLQSCTQGVWSTMKTCLTAALCDAQQQTCSAPACLAGQSQCEGSVLLTCNADLTAWDAVGCGSAALCNAHDGRCDPATCAPGESRCDGATWQTCLSDLTGWQSMQLCATPQLCDPLWPGCHEPACATGEVRCDGKNVQRCNAGRTGWDTIEHCGIKESCDAILGTCVPAG